MGLLLDRGLIEEAGTLPVPGRPKLYKTTKVFLRTFGLESLEQLPPLGDDSIRAVVPETDAEVNGQVAIAFVAESEESESV